MKIIKLTKGYVAKVDDGDFIDLSRYSWSLKTGRKKLYAVTRMAGEETLMHRCLIQPTGEVDHINGDGLDNRRVNLRDCNKFQNMANSKKRSDNESGYKGVCRYRGKDIWRAYIQSNKQWRHLGYHDSPKKAAIAYNKAAQELFGEFAWLNQI